MTVALVASLTVISGAAVLPATIPCCMMLRRDDAVCVPPSLITFMNVKHVSLLSTFSLCDLAGTSDAFIMPSAVMVFTPSFSILVFIGAA